MSERGGVYGKHSQEKWMQDFVTKPEVNRQLLRPNVDEKILLELILKQIGWEGGGLIYMVQDKDSVGIS